MRAGAAGDRLGRGDEGSAAAVAGLEGSVDDLREAEAVLQVRPDAQAVMLRKLHSSTEAKAAQSRDVVAAVKNSGESFVD
jgi:hypothetical protein